MDEKDIKPPLYKAGHVLYITSAFPPSPGGSCVLNQNLLSGFDNNSFTVISHNSQIKRIEANKALKIRTVLKSFQKLGRYNDMILAAQRPIAKLRIKKIAKRTKAKLIIGAYPNLYFVSLANEVAQELNIPFVAYLHDTVLEANMGTKVEKAARLLQENIFASAAKIFVMSDGMKALYKNKYNIETFPLRHTYHEKIERPAASDLKIKSKEYRLFWGGAVYNINAWSLSQLSKILPANATLELATNTSVQALERSGFKMDSIEHTFYSNRKEYLNAIKNSDFLILALDPQDKTKVNKDEIGTIFPTKTPEYLASGIPILVLCPKDYFLSKFFKEHDCGYVINSLEPDSINKMLIHIQENPDEVVRKVSVAFELVEKFFRHEVVSKGLISELNSIGS